MALRPIEQIQNAIIRPYLLQSGQSCYVGRQVVFGAASGDTAFGTGMNTIQDSGGASDLAIGIVRPSPYADATGLINAANIAAAGTGQTAANAQIEVMLFWPIIAVMQVGTGGTTRGKKQVAVASGITDAPTPGNTTDQECVGVALQSGVAGDFVGVGVSGINSRLS